MPNVFISYSHDSDLHRQNVLALADKLNQKCINCEIDQYINGSPEEGWPLWMEKQVNDADFVLIICTEVYLNRVQRKEQAGVGKGVKWESLLTYQDLYDNDSLNKKFIPVVFNNNDTNYIPKPLKSFTYYDLSKENSYELLYRKLTNQPLAVKPAPSDSILVLPPQNITSFIPPIMPNSEVKEKNNKKTILFIASNPSDTARLRLDKEYREVEESLTISRMIDNFNLLNKSAVRVREFRRHINNNHPSIIHFAGHGENEGIIIEKDDGNSIPLNKEGLKDFFSLVKEKGHLECVVFNACNSNEVAEAISWHIPYVIGMKNEIKDSSAIEFAIAFYDNLTEGYEVAFTEAKAAAKMVDSNVNPVIYINGILQDEQPKPPPAIEPPILNFKNRTAEIEKIFSATTKNFIVLDAPAGYGKTELLKKIAAKYGAENENSSIEFIDLKQQKSIQQALSYLHGKNGFGDYHPCRLANLLASKNNLIIFDNAEQISDMDNIFLFLKEAQDYDFSSIKIIIAGRYIASGINTTRWKKNGFDTISLSPLNQNVILEIIHERSPKNLKSNAKQKLAKKVYFLSGGHPKIIAILIALLEKDGWIFINSDKDIFLTHIHPNLDNIFEQSFVEFKLVCECFKKLSVFRQFNLSTISYLKEQKPEKFPLDRHAKDAIDLIAKLGLVTKRGNIGFYSDSIMRHLLRVCEKLYNEEDFFKINELAVPFYKKTMKDNPITVEFCSKEIVYHTLQKKNFDLNAVRRELKKSLTPCITSWGYSWESLDKEYFESFMEEDNEETIELLKEKDINSFCDLFGLD